MSKLEDDLKIPYVSQDLVNYLDKVFNIDNMLNESDTSADIMIGSMRGIRRVINHLRLLCEQREDDDD